MLPQPMTKCSKKVSTATLHLGYTKGYLTQLHLLTLQQSNLKKRTKKISCLVLFLKEEYL